MWKELDLDQVEKDLRGVLSRGITGVAVLLLHSYTSVLKLQSKSSVLSSYFGNFTCFSTSKSFLLFQVVRP